MTRLHFHFPEKQQHPRFAKVSQLLDRTLGIKTTVVENQLKKYHFYKHGERSELRLLLKSARSKKRALIKACAY